jgi:hypothetical protein
MCPSPCATSGDLVRDGLIQFPISIFLSDVANHVFMEITYRATDGAEKNGIGRLCSIESLVGKRNAMCVD